MVDGLELSRRGLLRLAGGAGLALSIPKSTRAAKSDPAGKVPGSLEKYDPPSMIRDFEDPRYGRPSAESQASLDELWNQNALGWTEQAINGNPYSALYQGNQHRYYNPLETDLTGGVQAMIAWTAFPNRINFYYPGRTNDELQTFADSGSFLPNQVTPNIPQDAECGALAGGPPILPETDRIPFPPYGPRGWLDEYCEIAYERNGEGKITKIHFTCENPEYWHTLWAVDPDRAAAVYRETLGNPDIKTSDLELKVDGKTVIDPATGRPAYNPLNPYNSGPVIREQGGRKVGGAMHLTSTPNTLQTEMQLASGATVQRTQGNENGTDLICCGAYGQSYRNSDPHIGQVDNQLVGAGFRVALANPIGLYIQVPDFRAWQLPDDPNLPADAKVEDCWHIVRGHETLPGFPKSMNFILHAKLEIPEAWRKAGVKFTVGDITINAGKNDQTDLPVPTPIRRASQVLQSMNIALFPLAVAAEYPAQPQGCAYGLDKDSVPPAQAFPQQIMYADLWDATYQTVYTVPNRQTSDGEPVTMNLASNTVIIAPRVKSGATARLALIGGSFYRGGRGEAPFPSVEMVDPATGEADPEIQTEVTAFEDVTYAVPGNSEPGPQQLLRLTVKVGAGAGAGQRSIRVTNPGQDPAVVSQPAPFFLWVEADT